jgi:hypothetical protein
MVWFIERAQEVTRLETRFDRDTGEYSLRPRRDVLRVDRQDV